MVPSIISRRVPLQRLVNLIPDLTILRPLSDAKLPVLTLFTKDPCPLCDEAVSVLAPALHKVNLEKVDITLPENKQWWDLYKYDIPVFHFNGRFLMKHKANLALLQDVLNSDGTTGT